MAETALVSDVELITPEAIAEWKKEFGHRTQHAAVGIHYLRYVPGEVLQVKLPLPFFKALLGKWGRKVGWFSPLGLQHTPLVGTNVAGNLRFTIEDLLVDPGSNGRVVWEQPHGGQPVSHSYWAVAGSFPPFVLGESRYALFYSLDCTNLVEGALFSQLVLRAAINSSSQAPHPTPLNTVEGVIVAGNAGKSRLRIERTSARLQIDANMAIPRLRGGSLRSDAGNCEMDPFQRRLAGRSSSFRTDRTDGSVRGGDRGGACRRARSTTRYSGVAGLPVGGALEGPSGTADAVGWCDVASSGPDSPGAASPEQPPTGESHTIEAARTDARCEQGETPDPPRPKGSGNRATRRKAVGKGSG